MQQAPVLEALFRQRDREFSETDLLVLVEEHRNRDTNNGGTSTPTVVRRLKELRIVEDAGSGEVGSAYRYAEVLADVHEYFAQTLAPISPESIEGAIVSIRKLVTEMEEARRKFSGSTVEGRAREMRQRCSQVLKGIEANYRHIMNEAASIRADSALMTAQTRFVRLERAFTTYIGPLTEIVHARGLLHQVLEEAARAVEAAEEDGLFAVPDQARSTLRRLQSLRDRGVARIRDCMDTIRPLIEKYRQQSLAAKGAGLLVDRLLQYGVESHNFGQLMPVLWVSARERYRDEQLLACARNIMGIVPQDPSQIDLSSSVEVELPDYAAPANLVEVLDAVEQETRIDDLWEFLLLRYPTRSAMHGLAAFYTLKAKLPEAAIQFHPETREYDFHDARLTAGIVSVAKT
jgi:hypothetical protein